MVTCGGGGGGGAGHLALVCGVWMWGCRFPIDILGEVWYLIVSLHPYSLSYPNMHGFHMRKPIEVTTTTCLVENSERIILRTGGQTMYS